MTSRFCSAGHRRRTGAALPASAISATLACAFLGFVLSACATGNYAPGGRFDPAADTGAATDADLELAAGVEMGHPPIENVQRIRLAFPTGDPRTSAILLEKEVPAEVVLETPFEYRILVENLTDRDLVQVRVQDSLPPGFKVESTEPVCRIVGGVARWELGMLAPHSLKTITVRGRATEMGVITTSATVDYVASLQATTKVIAPNLEVSIKVPDESVVTRPFDLTVRVINSGTGAARDVRIIDELPEGMVTETGQRRIVMDFGALASGQSKEKTITVIANAAGRFEHNVRAVAAGGIEVDASPVMIVLREPRLVLSVDAPEEAKAATPIRIELTIANTGDGVSDGTTIRCRLPVGVELVSVSEEGAIDDGVVAWWIGELAPGTSKSVAFTVWRDEAGAFVTETKAKARGAIDVTATARTTVQ